jgi:hypothetical protein
MEGFAQRTGLTPAGPERRYLWTDAFAVCNYLSLLRRTGDASFGALALRLIDRVHHVLGRHRADDRRRGWISGLDESEGEHHPTAGGLRIGKPLPERGRGDPYDPRLEWERDGQYYHYLTRWIHALGRSVSAWPHLEHHRWAVELARAAHRGFVHAEGTRAPHRMFWKMSIDLTRPLVASQGAHDPLDGIVTCCALEARAAARGEVDPRLHLTGEISALGEMCRGATWATDDALGIGGLLTDAWWTAQLLGSALPHSTHLERIFPRIVDAALASLAAFSRAHSLRAPAAHRLAFRELGLAIGLRAAAALVDAQRSLPDHMQLRAVRELEAYLPLAGEITSTWLGAPARATDTWRAHEDINDVMLATALLPDEYLRS